MKKTMTEKQAWAYLAKAWSNPTTDEQGCTTANGDRGICHSISRLGWSRKIGERVWTSMEDVMRKYREARKHGGFFWPTTVRGAACRAKFCAKQVERLSKKRGKK